MTETPCHLLKFELLKKNILINMFISLVYKEKIIKENSRSYCFNDKIIQYWIDVSAANFEVYKYIIFLIYISENTTICHQILYSNKYDIWNFIGF